MKTNIQPELTENQAIPAIRMKPKSFLIAGAAALLVSATAQAQAAVSLGLAGNFGVLAASTITNTGFTAVSGDIGVYSGTAITGFFGTNENDGPGIFSGTSHQGDAIAQQAQNDAALAFSNLNFLAENAILPVELGGQTLNPGVYQLGSAGMTGILTLDGTGDYVFQIDSTLTTASLATVNLINGADASSVFWAVGSSATLGANTDLAGTIIAFNSASLGDGASVRGRVLALNGAVTMNNNTIIPEPSSIALLAFLSLGLIGRRRRAAR